MANTNRFLLQYSIVSNTWKEIIMAYVINDGCISCGSCAAQGPVSAISQGDSQFVIDANTCIDCGSCAAQCPVAAITQG